jgi:hypothetical protein
MTDYTIYYRLPKFKDNLLRAIASKPRFAMILQIRQRATRRVDYPQGASQKPWLITWKPLLGYKHQSEGLSCHE